MKLYTWIPTLACNTETFILVELFEFFCQLAFLICLVRNLKLKLKLKLEYYVGP